MTPRYVLDATFALAALLPDEAHIKEVDHVFEEYVSGACRFSTTPLLPFEVGNGLIMAARRKRITHETACTLYSSFLRFRFEYHDVDYGEVALLAIAKDITVSDASYVWLAQKEKIQLLTLDKKIICAME